MYFNSSSWNYYSPYQGTSDLRVTATLQVKYNTVEICDFTIERIMLSDLGILFHYDGVILPFIVA